MTKPATKRTPTPGVQTIALWTSNTVHPTVGNLVGATLFGGPIGLAAGALAWAIARRTLVPDHR